MAMVFTFRSELQCFKTLVCAAELISIELWVEYLVSRYLSGNLFKDEDIPPKEHFSQTAGIGTFVDECNLPQFVMLAIICFV